MLSDPIVLVDFRQCCRESIYIFRPQAALGTGVSPASAQNVHLRYACAVAAKGGGSFAAQGVVFIFKRLGDIKSFLLVKRK